MIRNKNSRKAILPQVPAQTESQAPISRRALASVVDLISHTTSGLPEDIQLNFIGQAGLIVSGEAELVRIATDDSGNIRGLTALADLSLYGEPFDGDLEHYLTRYLSEDIVSRTFRLNNVNLVASGLEDLGTFGSQIAFKQVVKVKRREKGTLTDMEIPVYKGFLHAIVKDGNLIQLSSTVRHGVKPYILPKLVSEERAVEAARQDFATESELVGAQLMMSEHEGAMNPIFVVTLRALEGSASVKEYMVDARTGEPFHSRERMLFGGDASQALELASKGPLGKVLLDLPQPKVDIEAQLAKEVLDFLPDKSVLKNKYFRMLVQKAAAKSGKKRKAIASALTQAIVKSKGKSKGKQGKGKATKPWVEVKANADGDFIFKAQTPQGCAVINMAVLTRELELCERLGQKKITICLPVYNCDPQTEDNAFVDPTSPEMRTGMGTGVTKGGLVKWLAIDITICAHECGHWIVTIWTPGGDLDGDEGAAMHEAIGDIMAIIITCLLRLWYADKIGKKFTKKDLQADPFDVGAYAAAPGVIRHGRNAKKAPKKQTGEPHDDSEPVTGALVDTLTDWVLAWPTDDLEEAINAFLATLLRALMGMPAKKQLFKDLLNNLMSAVSQTAAKGKIDAKLIEKAFAKHDITVNGQPVVVKRRRPRKPKVGLGV